MECSDNKTFRVDTFIGKVKVIRLKRQKKKEYKVPPLSPSLPCSQDLEQNRMLVAVPPPAWILVDISNMQMSALITCQVQEVQQKLFWQINRISHPLPSPRK